MYCHLSSGNYVMKFFAHQDNQILVLSILQFTIYSKYCILKSEPRVKGAYSVGEFKTFRMRSLGAMLCTIF